MKKLALVTLVAAACFRGPPLTPKPAAPPDTLEKLREDARPATATACAPCHIGGHEDAKPAALAVFDVKQPNWTKDLDARRHVVFWNRIHGKLEGPQLAQVQRWLEAEKAQAP